MHLAELHTRVITALEHLSKGWTATRACKTAGITVSTFKHYVVQTPELQRYYEDCEQRGFDALADILLDIEDDVVYGSADPKMAKVKSENIKWLLSRRRPLQFGDRMVVDHNHTITADKAIVEALARGRERAENAVINITPIVLDAPVRAIEDELAEFR